MHLKKYIKEPEDFVVKEVIDDKFLRKFKRTKKGIEKMSGKYTLILVKKRNLTTEQALFKIARKFDIDKKSIGYAGLKDKFAVTEQYMTIKKDVNGFAENNIEVVAIEKINKHIGIGDLISNEFEITLHNADKKIIEKLKTIEKNGMKNYFGKQRFGIRNDNHLIGEKLAKKKFNSALSMINNQGRKYDSLENIPKERLKFYLHAYQSFLFNKELKKTKKAYLELKPIKIDELRIKCIGGKRKAVVKTNIEYEVTKKTIKLHFLLPKGSYATALMEQLGL